MKRVYLLRHAKAASPEIGLEDFDRPLAPRGRRASARMGGYMRDLSYRPDIALCSPACRTRQTWDLVRRKLDRPVIEEFQAELYHADPRTLLACLRRLGDSHSSALLIGHNPGIQTLALGLLGRSVATANPFGKYPTGALTVFDFTIDRWRDIEPATGVLIGFTRPKELDPDA